MHEPLVTIPPIHATTMLAEGHLPVAFDVAVAAHGLAHVRRRHLPMRPLAFAEVEEVLGITVEASLDVMGQLLVVGRADERELIEVAWQHGTGHVRTAADDHHAADALLDRIAGVLAEQERPADPRVPIWFWTLAEHGPEPMRRRLHAPTWEEIAGNYVPGLREPLARIMASPPDSARGVALWRGEPGTGKTTALRALAREWRDHVDVHVIVDPEVFLGDRANYLVQVLFGHEVDEAWDDGESRGGHWAASPAYPSFESVAHHGPPRPPRPSRAKLVVLEDAGELISSEARVSAGQALSRLLNLTDGMLGQGANVSVLVTTNEPIERLHPAVGRPGRSWAHLEFVPLPADAANDWLQHNGSADRVDAPATLAELYARLRGDGLMSLDALEE